MPATLVAGLPNITGSLEIATMRYLWANTGHGVLSSSFNNGHYSDTGAQEKNSAYPDIKFDASRSNSIYGSSTTVQPPAIILLPQIKYQGGDNVEILEAGLPNNFGNFAYLSIYDNNNDNTGVFIINKSNVFSSINTGNTKAIYSNIMNFDLQRNSNIYGISNTVQPPAITLIPQIKI